MGLCHGRPSGSVEWANSTNHETRHFETKFDSPSKLHIGQHSHSAPITLAYRQREYVDD